MHAAGFPVSFPKM